MYGSHSIQKRHRIVIALCNKQFERNEVAVNTDELPRNQTRDGGTEESGQTNFIQP
jgi:hypothetical protein